MTKNLKSKTINGVLWSSFQKFGTLLISFISNMILARVLLPEDFGVIGILTVFLSIADTFVNGGFGSALIQKKEPSNEDYSTVFYWNLFISLVFYFVLFFTSSFIANFYELPLLEKVLKIQGVILIFSAFNIVQTNKLIKSLDFKSLTKINVISTSIGAIFGVILAYNGFGVWSIVIKMLISSFVESLLLWFGSKWRPLFVFSIKSFKSLFSYGSLLLLSNLSETLILNVQSLIIGKIYSAKDLGYYTQAKSLNNIPERAIPQVVNQVMFPVFSAIQDDKNKVYYTLVKSMKGLAYITFPFMVLLSLIAEPLIILTFSDKWIDSVPYFRAFNFGAMLYALNSNNVNVIKSLGRSDYIIKLTLLKRSISLLFILIGTQFGILGIAYAYSLSIYLWFPINAHYSKKLIGYGFIKQIKDIGPNYIISITCGFVCYYFSTFFEFYYLWNMLLIIIIFITIYLICTYLFKVDSYRVFIDIVKKNKKK